METPGIASSARSAMHARDVPVDSYHPDPALRRRLDAEGPALDYRRAGGPAVPLSLECRSAIDGGRMITSYSAAPDRKQAREGRRQPEHAYRHHVKRPSQALIC